MATAPTTADVADHIQAELTGRVVIGHNVHVDLAVLGRELRGWRAPAALDTLRLAKAVWPGLPSYSLDSLTANDGVAPVAALAPSGTSLVAPTFLGGRHRAGYDVHLTAALFLALVRTVTATDRTTAACPEYTAGGWPSAVRLLVLAGALRADVHDDSARLF